MIVYAYDPCGLARQVAHHIKVPTIQMKVTHFADGELQVTLPNPAAVMQQRVTIIQSTGHPVNEMVLTVAFMIQELKNAGASHVQVIIPYFGYSRQESSDIPGKPGHGAVIAGLLERAGADNVAMVEVHKERLLSFFTIPAISLSLSSFFAQHIRTYFPHQDKVCLVAPDQGGYHRVAKIAQLLDLPVVVFSKKRYAPDASRITATQGACEGKEAIIIDDIISTGGTALHAAAKAQELGCAGVYGYFAHPVLPGDAYELLQRSIFAKIFVSNTLVLPEQSKDFKLGNKIEVLDISAILADLLQNK